MPAKPGRWPTSDASPRTSAFSNPAKPQDPRGKRRSPSKLTSRTTTRTPTPSASSSRTRPGALRDPRRREPREPRAVPAVTAKLLIIGGGKMGEALLDGLLAAGWADAAEVAVLEKVPARRDELAATHPGLVVTGDTTAAD